MECHFNILIAFKYAPILLKAKGSENSTVTYEIYISEVYTLYVINVCSINGMYREKLKVGVDNFWEEMADR